MLVIGRSASSFSGRSVSRSRTGTRPTWASQTATVRSRPGSSTVTVSGPARRVLDAPERQAGQVVVRVVVLLVAVGVDRLAEVALAVEEPDADGGQGHVAGRLHVVAGQDAETARVDPERLVEAVLGAEVGDRAARAGRRSVRWNQWSEPFAMYASNSARTSWYSARNLASSSRRDHSVGPLMTGIGLR